MLFADWDNMASSSHLSMSLQESLVIVMSHLKSVLCGHFYLFIFVLNFLSILHTNHSSPSLPSSCPNPTPHPNPSCILQKGKEGLPWVANKAWHIKLRQDQAFPHPHRSWARHPTIGNGVHKASSCTSQIPLPLQGVVGIFKFKLIVFENFLHEYLYHPHSSPPSAPSISPYSSQFHDLFLFHYYWYIFINM